MKKNGFTLIELITVVGILTAIGSIAVSVITVTLRSTRKTDLLESARQNGSTALSQMVKSIRYAQSLDSPKICDGTPISSIQITSLADHAPTIYSCMNNTIASNGASLIDDQSILIPSAQCSFACTQTTVTDPPTVTIKFTMTPLNTGGGFVDTTFTLPMQSSVTLRNY